MANKQMIQIDASSNQASTNSNNLLGSNTLNKNIENKKMIFAAAVVASNSKTPAPPQTAAKNVVRQKATSK